AISLENVLRFECLCAVYHRRHGSFLMAPFGAEKAPRNWDAVIAAPLSLRDALRTHRRDETGGVSWVVAGGGRRQRRGVAAIHDDRVADAVRQRVFTGAELGDHAGGGRATGDHRFHG